MSHCRFILGKKCTVLLSDIDNGGHCVCVGEYRESLYLSQCCGKPKTALKNCLKKRYGDRKKHSR